MQTSRTNYKKKKIMDILCFACLSADRKLNKLQQFKDVFKVLCKNIVQSKNPEVFLCFECLALLRNAKKFQNKVQTSQNILKSHKEYGVEINVFNLSTLSTSRTGKVDCTNPIANEEFSDTKPSLVLDIKQEEEYHNEYDYFDYDDEPLIRAKIDHPPESYFDKTTLETEINEDEGCNIKNETIFKLEHTEPKVENGLNGEITERDQNDFDGDFFFLPSTKNYIKTEKEKTKRSYNKSKGLENSTNTYKRQFKTNETFICDYCNKKCRSRRKIEKHIFIFHSRHPCTKCSMVFNTPYNLKKHIKRSHIVLRTEASYCVKCDRQFDNVPQFRAHLQNALAHRDERKRKDKPPNARPVQCLACPNMYAKRYSMMNHYNKVHVGKTRYHCNDCDRSFTNNTNLQYHLKYHHEARARERKHLCTICGRGFTEKKTMENHVRTHTGERPFECPHCESKFAQKYAMHTHVKKIHMKIDCSNTFLDAVTFTEGLEVSMRHCESKFAQKYAMHTHVKKIHMKIITKTRIKTSKTSKKGKMKKALCFGCLSADRKLHKLVQYKDVFKLMCKNVVQGKTPEIFLCFECLALLRNVKKFQEKVQKSQNILKTIKVNDCEESILLFFIIQE
ncbi:zinc-finger double domain-containing protein [Phthorimaea operculella]|nr:zinc-finger double domain-containing protein [Phthorimaea operculella]